jgi:hypothetical protein
VQALGLVHQLTSGITAPPSSPIGLAKTTPLPGISRTFLTTATRPQSSLQFPTPAKTLTALFSSQPNFTNTKPEPKKDIMGRLTEAEEGFNRWLAEVRTKKNHYRRIMAQQKADHKAIEDDMARLVELGPIIQAMAAEELLEVDEATRVQQGNAARLSKQRQELRQRVLNFEKLRRDLGEERGKGL